MPDNNNAIKYNTLLFSYSTVFQILNFSSVQNLITLNISKCNDMILGNLFLPFIIFSLAFINTCIVSSQKKNSIRTDCLKKKHTEILYCHCYEAEEARVCLAMTSPAVILAEQPLHRGGLGGSNAHQLAKLWVKGYRTGKLF